MEENGLLDDQVDVLGDEDEIIFDEYEFETGDHLDDELFDDDQAVDTEELAAGDPPEENYENGAHAVQHGGGEEEDNAQLSFSFEEDEEEDAHAIKGEVSSYAVAGSDPKPSVLSSKAGVTRTQSKPLQRVLSTYSGKADNEKAKHLREQYEKRWLGANGSQGQKSEGQKRTFVKGVRPGKGAEGRSRSGQLRDRFSGPRLGKKEDRNRQGPPGRRPHGPLQHPLMPLHDMPMQPGMMPPGLMGLPPPFFPPNLPTALQDEMDMGLRPPPGMLLQRPPSNGQMKRQRGPGFQGPMPPPPQKPRLDLPLGPNRQMPDHDMLGPGMNGPPMHFPPGRQPPPPQRQPRPMRRAAEPQGMPHDGPFFPEGMPRDAFHAEQGFRPHGPSMAQHQRPNMQGPGPGPGAGPGLGPGLGPGPRPGQGPRPVAGPGPRPWNPHPEPQAPVVRGPSGPPPPLAMPGRPRPAVPAVPYNRVPAHPVGQTAVNVPNPTLEEEKRILEQKEMEMKLQRAKQLKAIQDQQNKINAQLFRKMTETNQHQQLQVRNIEMEELKRKIAEREQMVKNLTLHNEHNERKKKLEQQKVVQPVAAPSPAEEAAAAARRALAKPLPRPEEGHPAGRDEVREVQRSREGGQRAEAKPKGQLSAKGRQGGDDAEGQYAGDHRVGSDTGVPRKRDVERQRGNGRAHVREEAEFTRDGGDSSRRGMPEQSRRDAQEQVPSRKRLAEADDQEEHQAEAEGRVRPARRERGAGGQAQERRVERSRPPRPDFTHVYRPGSVRAKGK